MFNKMYHSSKAIIICVEALKPKLNEIIKILNLNLLDFEEIVLIF